MGRIGVLLIAMFGVAGGASAANSVTPRARTIVVSLALTADGPQVYESGHLNGWSVEASMFLNVTSGADIMGPVRYGKPARPECYVRLTMASTGPKIKAWISPSTEWQPGMVLFSGGRKQAGAGVSTDYIAPWPSAPPHLQRIFRIASQP